MGQINVKSNIQAVHVIKPESGIPKQFDLWLNLSDPCMTFDPSNALCFGQGLFLPNLMAIGHF